MYDEDHSGGLSFEEIKEVGVQRLVSAPHEIDDIIEGVGEYLAKVIFDSAGVKYNHQLTKQNLQQALENPTEPDLVTMFLSIS